MQLKQACADFLSGYFSTHERSAKTRAAYLSDLTQFQEFAGPNKYLTLIDSTLVEDWAGQLRRDGYAPASIKRKIVLLKVFCAYWVRRGTLAESPFWRLKLSLGRIEQLPRALTAMEMRALLVQAGRKVFNIREQLERSAVRGSWQDSGVAYRSIRDLALVDILFATGIRVGEASALDVGDFLVHEAAFKIQGKGGRDRMAFAVDEKSLQIQLDHLEARKQILGRNSALFLNVFGGRLSTQGITNIIAQLRRDAGIERHVTPHMLRHTVATMLLRNGVDIRVVQEFLGHASIATTQRYTHVTKEHLVSVLKRLHPSIDLRSEESAAPGHEWKSAKNP